MPKQPDITQSFLDEIGGELLEGSGFEDEIPDPSFEIADSLTNPKRPCSVRKERGDAK